MVLVFKLSRYSNTRINQFCDSLIKSSAWNMYPFLLCYGRNTMKN